MMLQRQHAKNPATGELVCTCAPASQQCTGRVTWIVAGAPYSYDGNTTPVPVGGRAQATAQDGRTITITCRPGRRWGRL